MTTRTEMRERTNEDGVREFCQLDVTLRDREDGLELSICGTVGHVLTRAEAKQQALDYWQCFFEDEPAARREMNERLGLKCTSALSAARKVLDIDGEFHGLDVIEDGDNVYLGHSFGQIRDEIADFFPEAAQFFRFHLNHMNAGCEHQDARGEAYETHPGAECLECGWKLGHGWHKRSLPPAVIRWAKTGEGHAPSEPHYIAGPQWLVTGDRRKGDDGRFKPFRLNGAAPDANAAEKRARFILQERGYDHAHIHRVQRRDLTFPKDEPQRASASE